MRKDKQLASGERTLTFQTREQGEGLFGNSSKPMNILKIRGGLGLTKNLGKEKQMPSSLEHKSRGATQGKGGKPHRGFAEEREGDFDPYFSIKKKESYKNKLPLHPIYLHKEVKKANRNYGYPKSQWKEVGEGFRTSGKNVDKVRN